MFKVTYFFTLTGPGSGLGCISEIFTMALCEGLSSRSTACLKIETYIIVNLYAVASVLIKVCDDRQDLPFKQSSTGYMHSKCFSAIVKLPVKG